MSETKRNDTPSQMAGSEDRGTALVCPWRLSENPWSSEAFEKNAHHWSKTYCTRTDTRKPVTEVFLANHLSRYTRCTYDFHCMGPGNNSILLYKVAALRQFLSPMKLDLRDYSGSLGSLPLRKVPEYSQPHQSTTGPNGLQYDIPSSEELWVQHENDNLFPDLSELAELLLWFQSVPKQDDPSRDFTEARRTRILGEVFPVFYRDSEALPNLNTFTSRPMPTYHVLSSPTCGYKFVAYLFQVDTR